MAKISIAPMLDWSDRHFRYFMRQITSSATLYTEMIVDAAILHGNKQQLLGFEQIELPLMAQLGGSNPQTLAQASSICQQFGYSGINLNVGCPSSRVKSGNFGACLMANSILVAQCISSMAEQVTLPVTVKHRIGLDKIDDYNFLYDFVATLVEAGCKEFIVHARNAILDGLSPKQNREIPPLKYHYVYKLKIDFPHITFIINGGITTLEEINYHLQHVDGVMLGRCAYYNPYILHNIDNIYSTNTLQLKSRYQIAYAMLPYLEHALQQGIPLHHITRHMLGLYHGCNSAKLWRHTLSNIMQHANNLETYSTLLTHMQSIE